MEEAFHTKNIKVRSIGQDILCLEFMTPSYAKAIIEIAEEVKEWTSVPHRYATHDVLLEEKFPDLFEIIQEHLNHGVWPIVKKYWQMEDFNFQAYSAFVVKYSEDTQTSLDLHHDDSFISASIKLNDEYSGGLLQFPRQNADNGPVPVGSILVWPGRITHPHKCSDLTSGTKYSLTIWTRECTK